MEKQDNITKKRVFWVYFAVLDTKTPKCMERFQKRVFWMFMSVLITKTLKIMELNIYGNTKTTLRKKSVLSVFELNYQNAKEHAKHPLWRNIITLPKRIINLHAFWRFSTYESQKLSKYMFLVMLFVFFP